MSEQDGTVPQFDAAQKIAAILALVDDPARTPHWDDEVSGETIRQILGIHKQQECCCSDCLGEYLYGAKERRKALAEGRGYFCDVCEKTNDSNEKHTHPLPDWKAAAERWRAARKNYYPEREQQDNLGFSAGKAQRATFEREDGWYWAFQFEGPFQIANEIVVGMQSSRPATSKEAAESDMERAIAQAVEKNEEALAYA